MIKAAKSKDPVKGGEVVAEYAMSYYLIYDCALIPDGAVKEATCGKLEKIIGDIAGTGGGVVRDILEGAGINDFLKASGVTGLVDDAFTVVGNALAGRPLAKDDPKVCGPADQYYRDNFQQCYNRGAYLEFDPVGFNNFVGDLNGSCRKNFVRCYSSEETSKICDPMVVATMRAISRGVCCIWLGPTHDL